MIPRNLVCENPRFFIGANTSLGRGIAIDGIAGEQTLKALKSYQNNPIYSPQPSWSWGGGILDILACGARGEQVKCLQEILRGHGLNPGPVDGIFGLQTLNADRKSVV